MQTEQSKNTRLCNPLPASPVSFMLNKTKKNDAPPQGLRVQAHHETTSQYEINKKRAYLLKNLGVLEVVVHKVRDLRHPLVVKARQPPGLIHRMRTGHGSNGNRREEVGNKKERSHNRPAFRRQACTYTCV